jgi:hypothetical protein
MLMASLVSILSPVEAAIYIDTPFSEKVFDSVQYFDFDDTKWPFMKGSGDMLIGTVRMLTGIDFDTFFMGYQGDDEAVTIPPETTEITEVGSVDTDPAFKSSPLEPNAFISKPPNFLLVEFGGSMYSSSLSNIAQVAEWLDMDFVVLVVNRHATWYERLRFWWSHELPGLPADVMDAEERGDRVTGTPCNFVAVGPSLGLKILSLLEEFDTWNFEPSEYYFGIDDVAIMEGQTLMWRVSVYLVFIMVLCRWILIMDRRERQLKEGEEALARYTGDELGMGEIQTTSAQDCCVCLEGMQQGEMVRILPCRHVFHHECINGWFNHHNYSCPMCKMDLKKHLEERRVATVDIDVSSSPPSRSWLQLLWPWKRTIHAVSEGQLIDERLEGMNSVLGDLELNESPGVIV